MRSIRNDSALIQVEASLVVGADGTNSAVRKAMLVKNPKLKLTSYEDTNIRVYRTIPLHSPESGDLGLQEKYGDGTKYWGTGLTYSARSKGDINLEALPTKEGILLNISLL